MSCLGLFFFFFKQKTAYEMLRSLVGSEMCIRDSIGARFVDTFNGPVNQLPPSIAHLTLGKDSKHHPALRTSTSARTSTSPCTICHPASPSRSFDQGGQAAIDLTFDGASINPWANCHPAFATSLVHQRVG
eukprot:TRINITY_DN5621_c0_g1_i2.p1 TRINITY_DN5621_c0_g1~~TRINITY_DN5621_c0_g1_i2.p1  ORF type:complete len:131 (-),score=39.50 TRINITY_DN5621_c0_g1_i2:270-662(-)